MSDLLRARPREIRHSYRGEGHVKTEAEMRMMGGMVGLPPGAGKSKDEILPPPARGSEFLPSFRLLSSKTMREHISVVKSSYV